jgi:hypothetical protein
MKCSLNSRSRIPTSTSAHAITVSSLILVFFKFLLKFAELF